MAQRTLGDGRRLYRAAQQLHMKHSFIPVNYEEACQPQSPGVYSDRWLRCTPFFAGRNRWTAHNWATWTDADITEVEARARLHLRYTAIREQDYRSALLRLRDSQPHERSLNEKIASMHRGEYLIEEWLLPVRLVIREILNISATLLSAPAHILDPLKELREQIVSDLQDLEYCVNALSSVLRVRLNELLGPNTVQHTAIMHRLGMHLQQAQESRLANQKSLRLIWKHARPNGSNIHEADAFFKHSASSLTGDIRALRVLEDKQKILMLDQSPARWISTSFPFHFENAMVRQWSIIQSQVYDMTKFYNKSGASPGERYFRTWAFLRFRVILDKIQFALPHPYGQNGHESRDLSTLVRELQWIRNYRIDRFPDSVGQKEIRLARAFHMDMQRELFNIIGRGTHRHVGTDLEVRKEQRRLEGKIRIHSEDTEMTSINGIAQPQARTKVDSPGSRKQSEKMPPKRAEKIYVTTERSQREVPALVMAFRGLQSSQLKNPAKISNSVNARKVLQAVPQIPLQDAERRAPVSANRNSSSTATSLYMASPKSDVSWETSFMKKWKRKSNSLSNASIRSASKAGPRTSSSPPKAKRTSTVSRLADALHAHESLAHPLRWR